MGANETVDHVFEAIDAIAIKTKERVEGGGGSEGTRTYAEAMSALKIRANP